MQQLTITILFTLCTIFAMAQHTTNGLSRKECSAIRKSLIAEWKAEKRKELSKTDRTRIITNRRHKMKIWDCTYGAEPQNGHSLYISLHGGGGVPSQVNDQQWENQFHLYQPEEGIYVCPRAPFDAWDEWFQPPLDMLFKTLIEYYVTCHNVNPNRIYLMGYSAGGDGVWRMAPRMADSWAAASMMAGHPGETSMLSLRNLPFSIWCGAQDAAYNRNTVNSKRGKALDALQRQDPSGYIHSTHIVQGKGHWMDRVDAAAVGWMSQYTRNPYPTKIVWAQGNTPHYAFYWVSVPEADYKENTELQIERKGNTINILKTEYPEITIWLNDEMVNLDKPVIVTYKGRTIWNSKVNRSKSNLRESLWTRGDINYAFPAKIKVNM